MWYVNRLSQEVSVKHSSLWIVGSSRSGKTTRLVDEFTHWVSEKNRFCAIYGGQPLASSCLVFAANDDNRRELTDKLSLSVPGSYPVTCKTPLGFITDEVMLFWPLLFERLNLKAQFPLRLRPETEQDLATQLWRPKLPHDSSKLSESTEYRFVRQTLDLLQLAGASGMAIEDIPSRLEQGLPETEGTFHAETTLAQFRGNLILEWQEWCLQRGLLSYGIIYELYWRYLLPTPQYQQHLIRRYQAIFADDVDDYPAIAQDLGQFLLDNGPFGVFTFNPDGQIRVGLNADPDYLERLAANCHLEALPTPSEWLKEVGEQAIKLVTDFSYLTPLDNAISSVQTASRAELLRQTANFIIQAVKAGEIQPEEIAIIAPGLDEIGRYTLIEILSAVKIPTEPVNEQRPLVSSPLVRALLSLLGLVYSGLGRLILRDDIAEMLVILSQSTSEGVGAIDPVRAGLIADYCYHIDPERPSLLPVETFPRWDRLGHQAVQAYQMIRDWIATTQALQQQQRLSSPILVLDRAIETFFSHSKALTYDRLAVLRELTETAQHYWDIDRRLRQSESEPPTPAATLAQFIQLLRRGTITANPRPLRYFGKKPGAVTLATIFQYRSLRTSHRWQFWLDAASPLWEKGGAATLFAAPLFLRDWSGGSLTPDDELEADRARLQRILRDLLGRVGERVFLCHSDLSVKGTEQAGPLLTLVQASQEIISNPFERL